jgi:serine/threonine-protein kinase
VTVSTSDPIIGRLVDGRYQVRSRIARGGMATVYLATDLRLERRVAIKVMHGHLADDSQFKQRFIQEARSAARLAHPNVVNVFDQGQDEDSAYLVMEYLPGITLRDLLQEYGSLTSQQTIDITEAVLSGLAAAHKAGIVHRDLKPENVLLADDGRIKIGDFGLARAASANTATGAALLGTIAYLSPELVTRGIADTRSDIYAVGIMMYEMLTGEQPFKGEQPMQIAYQHANDSVPTPSSKNPQVPVELDELVLWATARDPEERPRDARELLEELRTTESLLETALPTGTVPTQKTRVLTPLATPAGSQNTTGETVVLGRRGSASATGPVNDATTSLATRSQRRRRRGWILFGVVLALTALAAGAGWWFSSGPGGHVTVPASIVGADPAAATATLQGLGFDVATERGEVYSVDVPVGMVATTDPAVGASVLKGTQVTLNLSLGPKAVIVPALTGMPLDEATQTLTGLGMIVGEDPVEQFDPAVAEGAVVSAATADGADLSAGGDSFEGVTVNLVVSAGALPAIQGMTFDDARDALIDVGLDVESAPRESYHDTVPTGQVIGLVETGAIHPGDSVTIDVSQGPPPVTIPDVAGKTWAEARDLLTAAGLATEFWNNRSRIAAESAPGASTVDEISPGAGQVVPKGTVVRVRVSLYSGD